MLEIQKHLPIHSSLFTHLYHLVLFHGLTEYSITVKDLARLLPVRSLHLSAGDTHRSGVRELSGPTKGAKEAVCRPVHEGRNRGKVKLISSSRNDTYSRK